jgi:hypothetical protein
MGLRKGAVCGVGLVRECGWGCSLGAEVAWWSAYVQVDVGEELWMGVGGSGDQRSVNDARSVSEEHLPEEKAGCWTRRRAFEQVRDGSNIQLLSYP